MRRGKRERFDMGSGLQDLREIISVSRPGLVRDASGVATLTGIRIGPSLGMPLIHPVALSPAEESRSRHDMAVGLGAVVMGLAALGGIIALAVSDFGAHPRWEGLDQPAIVAFEASAVQSKPPPEIVSGVAPVENQREEAGVPSLAPSRSKTAANEAGTDRKERRADRKARKPKARKEMKAVATKAPSDSTLPRSLSRVQLKQGMMSVASRAKRCDKGHGGVVMVEMVIGPDGRVESSVPTGVMAASPTGKCVAKAVKAAKFPPFSGSKLTVKYPFIL